MKYIEINLPVGQLVAMVDDEDFERVNQFRWGCSAGQRYARAYSNKSLGGMAYMHRFILGGINPKLDVHHIDNDPLNNQKSNLEVCTTSENLRGKMRKYKNSTSQFRGVYWDAKLKTWRAGVDLGRFSTEAEAAKEWNRVSEFAWGDRGQLNDLVTNTNQFLLPSGDGGQAGIGLPVPA